MNLVTEEKDRGIILTEVPKKKPYTKKMFMSQTELYLKGAKGGFEKYKCITKLLRRVTYLENKEFQEMKLFQ